MSPDYHMTTARVRCKDKVLFPEEASTSCEYDGVVYDLERLKYFSYQQNLGENLIIRCFIPIHIDGLIYSKN